MYFKLPNMNNELMNIEYDPPNSKLILMSMDEKILNIGE